MSRPINVLLIEDNPADVGIIRDALAAEREARFTLTVAGRLSAALNDLKRGGFDLVLLDLLLPDSEGLQTLKAVRTAAPQAPLVVLTASDDEALAVQALQQGAQDYLVKGYVQVYRNLLGRSMRYAIERKRAEEDIRSAQAHTEKLLASIPSILIGVNAEGLVTHWNGVAEATFGVPSALALARPLAECPVRWDAAKIQGCLAACRRTGASCSLDEVAFTRPDGQEGFVGLTLMPMRRLGEEGSGILLFGADITQRKQAEAERAQLQEQLLQAQKMETIGRFAGGIAHDFNNFLQIILGFTWLIHARAERDPELANDLQEIMHASESASGMVRQLLAFSRRQPLQLKPIEINQTIRNMRRLLQQLVGERITVELRLAEDPLVVKLDPTWVEQILINLCANARDSMPQGGTLSIRTAGVTADDAFLEARPWWTRKGRFVQCSIQDTGVGMDPDVAKHIFEPFYSTKPMGKGTGLGLAVVYGLVRQHEGIVDVETAPGRGTTFHLYFPAQDVRSEEVIVLPEPSLAGRGPAPAEVSGDGGRGPGRKPRVLVVDDNPPILQFCERILSPAYQVTTASSGREALDALRRTPYDLLLTDLRMPNMDGIALLAEASKLQPRPKLLAMTGSISNEMEQRLRDVPLDEKLVRKPFTAPMLRDAVSCCLR